MKQCKNQMPELKVINRKRVKSCLECGVTHMDLGIANLEGHTCAVARALQGKRIPISEVPVLPLIGCDAKSCGCYWGVSLEPLTEQQLKETNQDPHFRVTVQGFGRMADIQNPQI